MQRLVRPRPHSSAKPVTIKSRLHPKNKHDARPIIGPTLDTTNSGLHAGRSSLPYPKDKIAGHSRRLSIIAKSSKQEKGKNRNRTASVRVELPSDFVSEGRPNLQTISGPLVFTATSSYRIKAHWDSNALRSCTLYICLLDVPKADNKPKHPSNLSSVLASQ